MLRRHVALPDARRQTVLWLKRTLPSIAGECGALLLSPQKIARLAGSACAAQKRRCGRKTSFTPRSGRGLSSVTGPQGIFTVLRIAFEMPDISRKAFSAGRHSRQEPPHFAMFRAWRGIHI